MQEFKKNLFFFLFVGLLTPIFAQDKPTKSNSIYNLDEAISQKLITTEITAIGGHVGERLTIVCKNITNKQVKVRIPMGQFMMPADSNMQRLVVVEEQMLTLLKAKQMEVNLKTLCSEQGDISPAVGTVFSVGAMASEQVIKLLNYAVEKKIPLDSDFQSAMWCMTGRPSLGSIANGDLREFVANALGKELPGYKIIHKKVVEIPGQRADLGEALVVEGNFRYYLKNDEKVEMVLLDRDEKFVKKISKVEDMKAGEHRSKIRLEVFGLEPGDYILRMHTVKDKRVIKDMKVAF